MTWYEAVSFCRWLSTQPGFAGTSPGLPQEEVWEYACRAGSETRFWRGDGDGDLGEIGWYGANSDGRTHRVGQKPANRFGLYDVHGNVWEWTATEWDAERYRSRVEGEVHRIDPTVSPADLAALPRVGCVLRGGSCWFSPQWCRSAYRYVGGPGDEVGGLGFRVLLSSAPSPPTPLPPAPIPPGEGRPHPP